MYKLAKHILVKLLIFAQKYPPYRRISKCFFHKLVNPKVSYEVQKKWDRDRVFCFTALYNKRKIGTVVLIYRESKGWELSSLSVSPRFRGFGIGEKLVSDVLNTARKNNIKNIYLTVSSHKKPAITLYKKCGFLKNFSCTPLTRNHILMNKAL